MLETSEIANCRFSNLMVEASWVLLTHKSGDIFRVVFFLISLISPGSPHVRPMGVHRTCGGPNEIELTPTGVKLNGSRLVPGLGRSARG